MARITFARLRELLDYDPETGVFTRRVDTGLGRNGRGRHKAGSVSGSLAGRYRTQWLDGRPYLEHRVAWLWMTGSFPKHQIDHVNLDKTDNKWANLREATISQNSMNKKGWAKYQPNRDRCGSKPWKVSIQKDGKSYHVGVFASLEEAKTAHQAAAHKLHGEFARVS